MKFILRSIILLTAAPSIILAADSDPSYLWSKAVEAVNWVGHAKFDYVCHQSSVRIRDSRKTESSSEANGTIWQLTPRMRVDASSHAKGDTLPPAISTKILTPKERFIWFKDDSIEINRASRIFHEEAGSHYALFIFTWPLDGVAILDSKTQVLDLKTVGQRGKLTRLADETISGFLCNVVRAEGDGWTCTIWVSPERDYNLARYHLQVMENPAIAGRGAVSHW